MPSLPRGLPLLLGALVALVWANVAHESYLDVLGTRVGPDALDLDLTLSHWAADGLLAIFFFVAGLELKRELVVGELRTPATAALPVLAAACGMAVPAAVYLVTVRFSSDAADGWAIPTATDIAFALTVLAVLGRGLPSALRAFLLTLAVVDDLGAITIIAVAYTDDLDVLPLLGAVAGLVVYAGLQRRRVTAWWAHVPLAAVVWGLVHAGGVHATVAGVALGLLTRARPDTGEARSPAERLEHRLSPLSDLVALPLFALAAAGVALRGDDLRAAVEDPAAVGVALGLVAGKFVGVLGGTYLATRLTRARLDPALAWADVATVAALAGIGFTVSLLIGDLAFAEDPARAAAVKVAVLAGSLCSAGAAAVLLRRRQAHHGNARRGGEVPS